MNTYSSLNSIKNAIQANEINCLGLVKFYIKQIEKSKQLNAFVETFEKEAIDIAILIDEKITNGTAGKLAGMIIGIKDNICYKNHKSTAASKMLLNFESIYSATVIERLLNEDAIINILDIMILMSSIIR